MEESNSLAIFTRAAQMLVEANTIQKAKELKDLALTAADWAKRKNMGEEAINYCRSYALEAERKMGEMLIQTERAQGRRTDLVTPCNQVDCIPTLAELNLTKRESSEAQKIAALPIEKFEEIKTGKITKTEALSKPHVFHNSGENEWYTPTEYIDAAITVMGQIDIDPASSDIANKIVGAAQYFTIEDDGLTKEWKGKIWMNPPYAQPLVSQFSEAIASKYESGEVTEACILVNNATETAWFQRMLSVASAVCFLKGRIKFLDREGNASGAPLQGQAILYFGNNDKSFYDNFSQFGVVLVHAE